MWLYYYSHRHEYYERQYNYNVFLDYCYLINIDLEVVVFKQTNFT